MQGAMQSAMQRRAAQYAHSTYLNCFMTPTLAQLQDMQQAVAAFVASTDRPDEETPYKSKLYPRSAVMALPVCKGGMALPVLQHSFAAMRAKSVWQALRFSHQRRHISQGL
jgi:hypothetical protein